MFSLPLQESIPFNENMHRVFSRIFRMVFQVNFMRRDTEEKTRSGPVALETRCCAFSVYEILGNVITFLNKDEIFFFLFSFLKEETEIACKFL